MRDERSSYFKIQIQFRILDSRPNPNLTTKRILYCGHIFKYEYGNGWNLSIVSHENVKLRQR